MIFANIPMGTSLFVDANTFVYNFGDHPQFGAACKHLLERIARLEVHGITSAHVLGDLAHRAMTLEAIDQFGWPAKGIAMRLGRNPVEVQKLTRFRQAVEEIPQIGIRVLPIESRLITDAAALSQRHGLLTGDALIVAVMQANGLSHLASHDTDFDRVPGITRYGPA